MKFLLIIKRLFWNSILTIFGICLWDPALVVPKITTYYLMWPNSYIEPLILTWKRKIAKHVVTAAFIKIFRMLKRINIYPRGEKRLKP